VRKELFTLGQRVVRPPVAIAPPNLRLWIWIVSFIGSRGARLAPRARHGRRHRPARR